MLKKRGMAFTYGKLADIPAIEAEINKYIINNKDEMKSPCTAFITFTTDEAYELANDYLFKKTQAGLNNEKYEKFSLFG